MNPFENIYNHIPQKLFDEPDKLAGLKQLTLAEAMNALISGDVVVAGINVFGDIKYHGEFCIENNCLEIKRDGCWECYHCPINTVLGFNWYESNNK